MKNNLPGTLWGKDIEFLHDFRVACRRSRSILSQLKSAFPESAIKPFLEDFAWLSRLTSAVRDLDVFLLKLRSEEFKNGLARYPSNLWLAGLKDAVMKSRTCLGAIFNRNVSRSSAKAGMPFCMDKVPLT